MFKPLIFLLNINTEDRNIFNSVLTEVDRINLGEEYDYSVPTVDFILKLSRLEGNTVSGISHSALLKKTVWMNNLITHQLREKIKTEKPELVYRQTQGKPHDPATEYFLCSECGVALIFPK